MPPIEAVEPLANHWPEATIFGLFVFLAPILKDLILGWWKKKNGETPHESAHLSELRALMHDFVARLRDHAERDSKDTEEMRDAIDRIDEKIQRVEVDIARLRSRGY